MRDDWRNELKSVWPILRARRSEGEVVLYPLSLETKAGPVRAGMDRTGGHHLLVPLSASDTIEDDRRSEHVRLERRVLKVDGHRQSFFDIWCRWDELYDVFDDVLATMLEQVSRSQRAASYACVKVWEEWRLLLQARTEPLSDEAVRGLFAELVILESIVTRRPGIQIPLVWTGPDRLPHDFSIRDNAIEVKAIGPRGTKVRIHGLGQLDTSAVSLLFLALVRIEKDRESGFTIPEIVERLRDVTADPVGLSIQLAKAGYFDAHAELYANHRYAIHEEVYLSVDENFPRVVASSFIGDVPSEVSELAYTLDLTSRLPNAILREDAYRILMREV